MLEKLDQVINKITNTKKNKYLFGLVLFSIFGLMYILNIFFPLMIDDWDYSFVFGVNPARRVQDMYDIYQSQFNLYNGWGGRIVVHTIAQILLLLDPFWHDLLNTIAFVSLIFIIYKISNYRNQTQIAVLLLLSLMFWFLQPGFASTFFWITGSANYLWGALIVVLFMLPYFISYQRDEKPNNNIILGLLFFFLGIIAGWTNENMAIALIFHIAFYFYLLKKENRKISLWAICGLVGVIIGAIIMIKAPGNYIRYIQETAQKNMDTAEGLFSLKVLIYRLPKMFFLYFKRLLYFVVPYLVLLHYVKKQQFEDNIKKKKVINTSIWFFFSANVSFWAMIAVPGIPTRAFFGIITLFIIAIGILYANLNFKEIRVRRINFILLSIALLVFVFDYSVKYKNIRLIHDTLENRAQIITKGKEDGVKDFIFYDHLDVSSRYFYVDCNDNPDFWINRLYSNYYSINSIRVYPKEAKNKK